MSTPDGEKDMGSEVRKQRPLRAGVTREDLAGEVALSTSILSNCFLLHFCFCRYIPAVVDRSTDTMHLKGLCDSYSAIQRHGLSALFTPAEFQVSW